MGGGTKPSWGNNRGLGFSETGVGVELAHHE